MKVEKYKSPKIVNNLDAVMRYSIKQDIVLNAEQEELLQRLQFADEKIRSRRFTRDEILTSLRTRFGVSKWRAEQDITEAHKVFGKARVLNKPYLLADHIDNIARQIQLVESAKKYELLPKLNDSYTYALNSLPPEALHSANNGTKIIFIIKESNRPKRTIDELLAEADKLLKENKPTTDEYIEFSEQ